MRRAWRVAMMWAAILAMLGLAGCAGVGSALSGGSVPIGDVDGWVYSAAMRAPAPVADAPVELVAPSGDVLARARTDGQGYFLFRDVRADDRRLVVRCAQALESARVEMEFAPDELGARVALVLSEQLSQVYSLIIVPASVPELAVGSQMTFSARGIVGNQQAPFVDVPVSWAVKGKSGTLEMTDPYHATFTGTRPGTALVVAQYQGLKQLVNVKVVAAE